ncbi:MAG: hypothetical protein ABL916_23400 [Burkholderiaceae bacterium]
MTWWVMAWALRATEHSATPQWAVIDNQEPVMSNLIQPSVFLRRALVADALVSAAAGAVMALGANLLQGLLAIPSALLLPAGLAFFPYAAYLLWLATRRAVPRAAVWVPIVLNVLWAVECVLFAFNASPPPTLLGEAFIASQAIAVLVFAGLEYSGLRRACAIVAA